MSCGVEQLQYLHLLGTVEVDDVLCNTFGALLAMLNLLASACINTVFSVYHHQSCACTRADDAAERSFDSDRQSAAVELY